MSTTCPRRLSGWLSTWVRRRIVRVGDVAVSINGAFDMGHKRVDTVAAACRAALLQSMLDDGATICDLQASNDPGREMILPLLRAQAVWRNQPQSEYGFGSLDGTATPAEMIDVFDVPLEAEVVIATDGYIEPRSTLAFSEQTLANTLAKDPLRIGPPPGTKGVMLGHGSFDDRTYLRLRF